MHPKTRQERRKINYKIAKRNKQEAINIGMIQKENFPLNRFVDTDAFDCGNPHCSLCHGERSGKPIPKEEIEYE